jgi:hypothetical protein
MKTLLDAIGAILRPELVQGGPIRLEEPRPESTCKPITLHKRGKALVLRPDQRAPEMCDRPGCQFRLGPSDRLFPLYKLDVANLTAVCDYIIFYQNTSADDAPLFILLCELKSKNLDGSTRQMENGGLLADYVVNVAKHHARLSSETPIIRRGLLFSTVGPLPKGDIRTTPCAYKSVPGSFSDMRFIHYRCGQIFQIEHFCS